MCYARCQGEWRITKPKSTQLLEKGNSILGAYLRHPTQTVVFAENNADIIWVWSRTTRSKSVTPKTAQLHISSDGNPSTAMFGIDQTGKFGWWRMLDSLIICYWLNEWNSTVVRSLTGKMNGGKDLRSGNCCTKIFNAAFHHSWRENLLLARARITRTFAEVIRHKTRRFGWNKKHRHHRVHSSCLHSFRGISHQSIIINQNKTQVVANLPPPPCNPPWALLLGNMYPHVQRTSADVSTWLSVLLPPRGWPRSAPTIFVRLHPCEPLKRHPREKIARWWIWMKMPEASFFLSFLTTWMMSISLAVTMTRRRIAVTSGENDFLHFHSAPNR